MWSSFRGVKQRNVNPSFLYASFRFKAQSGCVVVGPACNLWCLRCIKLSLYRWWYFVHKSTGKILRRRVQEKYTFRFFRRSSSPFSRFSSSCAQKQDERQQNGWSLMQCLWATFTFRTTQSACCDKFFRFRNKANKAEMKLQSNEYIPFFATKISLYSGSDDMITFTSMCHLSVLFKAESPHCAIDTNIYSAWNRWSE